jgi:hypothetical protein
MRPANAVHPNVAPGLIAALVLAVACAPKGPASLDAAKYSPEVKPPEEPEPEPATIEQPDVGTPAEDETGSPMPRSRRYATASCSARRARAA